VVIELSREYEALVRRAEAEWIERFVAGPKRLPWEELPAQVGDPAPDTELRDSAGGCRRLREFWADGPVLLLFWRQFGCDCGIERAARLAEEYGSYTGAGGTVAIVGEGDPERAAEYATEYDIECPILCDPAGSAHEKYGLLDFEPIQVLYDLPELLDRNRRIAERIREEGQPQVDNPWQQAGEFVVDGDGVLQLTYRTSTARTTRPPGAHGGDSGSDGVTDAGAQPSIVSATSDDPSRIARRRPHGLKLPIRTALSLDDSKTASAHSRIRGESVSTDIDTVPDAPSRTPIWTRSPPIARPHGGSSCR
jgi:peroxiredoxin